MNIGILKTKIQFIHKDNIVLIHFNHKSSEMAFYLLGLQLLNKIKISDFELDMFAVSHESLVQWANSQDDTIKFVVASKDFKIYDIINIAPAIKSISIIK